MPRLFLAFALWLLTALPAFAQSYPARPIRIIVPFAPGASSDATARALAQELGARVGQSVVVENNGGGGGVTGLQQMARAAPDGYTLAIGAAGATLIVPLMPGAPAQWDPVKDLLPVAGIVRAPVVIVANPASGLKTLADVVAKAKSLPDGLTYGSTGANSLMHLAVEFLSFKTGAKLVHVPYRGSAPAIMDAVAGQVPFVAVDLTSALPLLEAGKVVGLAAISDRRTSFAPDVPSMAELGYSEFAPRSLLSLYAPVGTPPAIVDFLNTHIREIVDKPDFKKQVNAVALEPAYLDNLQLAKLLDEERARWRVILRSIGKLQEK